MIKWIFDEVVLRNRKNPAEIMRLIRISYIESPSIEDIRKKLQERRIRGETNENK